jgi:hypothetical protein
MPVIYLKLIMASLVLALCLIIYMGQRILRHLPALNIPKLRSPAMSLRIAMPNFGHTREGPVSDADRHAAQRARQLAAARHGPEDSDETISMSESFLEETMRCLEQAFNSFESDRISADTFRSMLLAEKRAVVRRRAGLAARDEEIEAAAGIVPGELAEANAAVEAVEWCLDWLDKYEQPRQAA